MIIFLVILSAEVQALKGGVFKDGVGPIYGTKFDCTGEEEKLTDCIFVSDIDPKKCPHSHDAGVICKPAV